MNHFLKGNKILEVQNQLISNANGACWKMCKKIKTKPGFMNKN